MRGEDMDATEVGKRIKMFREKAGIKQNALATAAGVSPTYIYQVERGEKCPTVEYLDHICWGLGITLEEFFGKEIYDKIAQLTSEQKKLLNDFLTSLHK